jgi:imidazolonepropionase-like amidohydrolase
MDQSSVVTAARRIADIVVVKGDPLFDIVALSNVDVVVKNGAPYQNAERMPPVLRR